MRAPRGSGRFVGPQRHRAAAGQAGRAGSAGLQQREVVDDVEGQQLQRALLAVDGGVDQPVARRLQRVLADDVVVGDQVAGVVDQETRAHRRLAVLRLQQRAHLQQQRPRAFVDALAGAGHRRQRRSAAARWPRRRARRLAAAGRRSRLVRRCRRVRRRPGPAPTAARSKRQQRGRLSGAAEPAPSRGDWRPARRLAAQQR